LIVDICRLTLNCKRIPSFGLKEKFITMMYFVFEMIKMLQNKLIKSNYRYAYIGFL